MELKIKRLSATLALIWCEGGRVLDCKSSRVYSEIETACKEWQSDEQILADFKPI